MSSPLLTGVISILVLVVDSNQTQSQLLYGGALRRQGTFRVASVRAQLSECLSVLENDPADVVLLADRAGSDRHRFYEFVRGVRAASPRSRWSSCSTIMIAS